MNGVMLQAFEWELPGDGTHWQTLAQRALSLRAMGFSAIWMPPAYKGNGGQYDVGYGVYDLYDLGAFDQKGTVRTKYGTEREYLRAVKACRRAGLQVLADVVLNHRMGADETEQVPVRAVNPQNRGEIIGEAQPGEIYTRFTFPGRGDTYSGFVWNHTCFTAVDWNGLDPDHHLFLIDGKSFAADVDEEHGNYDYLMGADVDHSNPAVREELLRWAGWYLRHTGVDGFRLDAVKHISASFYAQLLPSLRAVLGRELFAVGEYWSGSNGRLLRYLDDVGECMSLFDVPLHEHLHQASNSGGEYDMRRLFEDTLVGTRPHLAVTFVDNHDTQPGQSLESWVGGWFKAAAYGLILLRAFGYPCVFWGDLYGIPTSGVGAVPELPWLMYLRSHFAYGEEQDYFDHEDVIGFVREGSGDVPGSGLVFLCTNRRGGDKRMNVGSCHRGRWFVRVLGSGKLLVKTDRDGWGAFRTADGAACVYVPVTWQGMAKLAAKKISEIFHKKAATPT
ncbi:MAG: alpha-amylase [Clostridia bacterium]|nr:alpha-amylase [Clostridia bacterium]